jgi:Xaa-Pro aminopeptidase
MMEREGIDVLVCPQNTGGWDQLQANSRYLTTIGGFGTPVAVVFPADGAVTALTGPVPSKTHWLAFQDWVEDVRPNFFSMGESLVQRLKEQPGIERARIGLAYLADVPRNQDGAWPVGTYQRIRDAFPEADLVNATALLEDARFIKSDEEIDALRRAVELVDAAIERAKETFRPGVRECEIYAAMQAAMIERGGDGPNMLLWSAGNPQPAGNAMMPTMRRLEAGDIISAEIEAKWAGYIGQVTTNFFVGPPPDEYLRMSEIQLRAVDALWEALTPGVKVKDLFPIAAAAGEGSDYQCRLILHGRGLGNDPPLAVFASRDQRTLEWTMEENAVVIVKPAVLSGDWFQSMAWGQAMGGPPSGATSTGVRNVCWGDSVVVTPSGARRLGETPPGPVELS